MLLCAVLTLWCEMVSSPNKLTRNFSSFFGKLNPSQTYIDAAATAHAEIRDLIEDKNGPAADLAIRTFIQGSYGRHTAIHTINDVDIVALCNLAYRPSANRATRDQIHKLVVDSITRSTRYKNRVHHGPQSMCVKVELKEVTLEILPALRALHSSWDAEPFYMFRPGNGVEQWQQTFARKHQELLTNKNRATSERFIPMIKVLKHVRALDALADTDAVSFHIECLLYAVADSVYSGSTCECIGHVLRSLSGFTPAKAAASGLRTPCRDRALFATNEWASDSYARFYGAVQRWLQIAERANTANDPSDAIAAWQELLGRDYFPAAPE